MDCLPFSRSKALNNIPANKIHMAIVSMVELCEVCSKKKLNMQNSIDGLCARCSVAATLFNRYGESNIPMEYWDLKMERDFKGDPRLLKKYNEIVGDLKSCFINGVSICFAGTHGIGKTLCCTNILKRTVAKGYFSLYCTWNDMVDTLIQAPNDEKFLAKKELCMVDFLVIDEVDSRFIASENMADLYARQLEYVVRSRRSNKLPTFLCTNSPNMLEVFNGALKQSMSSITSGHMETFVVLGTDFRKIA
jgi:DNA replication protein DnaC